MVELTRFNGTKFYLNSDHIEFVEETPDTVITLVSGKKLVVTESAAQILESIVVFRNSVITGLPPVREVDKISD